MLGACLLKEKTCSNELIPLVICPRMGTMRSKGSLPLRDLPPKQILVRNGPFCGPPLERVLRAHVVLVMDFAAVVDSC